MSKLARWEKKEKEMLEALADGHPNPEGFMEKWYQDNPKPKGKIQEILDSGKAPAGYVH